MGRTYVGGRHPLILLHEMMGILHKGMHAKELSLPFKISRGEPHHWYREKKNSCRICINMAGVLWFYREYMYLDGKVRGELGNCP